MNIRSWHPNIHDLLALVQQDAAYRRALARPSRAKSQASSRIMCSNPMHRKAQPTAAERKRFATLAARAASVGQELIKVTSGSMLARLNYARHFTDLDTATVLIRSMKRNA